MKVQECLNQALAEVSAWRFFRGDRSLTLAEYEAAPKDGRTTSRFLGTFKNISAVPADATHIEPAMPKLHDHMRLVPAGRTVVSFGLPSCRLDLDDGSAVDGGQHRSTKVIKAHDKMWLSIALA